MTIQIKTDGIDTNFPVAGQDNDSQGFRNNFSQIKTALDAVKSTFDDISGTPSDTSSIAGWIKIDINGTDSYIPYYR